jgi:DNA topoisomerase-1
MDTKGVKKDVYTLQYSNGKYSEKTVSITSGAVKDKLFALEVGKTVTEFLENNFANLVEYEFTKSVEEELDMIASGQKVWTEVVKKVYDSFAAQIEHIRENASTIEGGGKIKKYLGVNDKTGADISIIFNKSGPSIYTELANGEKKYCNITDNEVMDMTIEKAIDLLKYPILLKAPDNLVAFENDIEICKGKTNYYLKQNKKSIPLTDNVDTEPDVISWAVGNELFKNNIAQSTSRILKSFEEDKKLSIVNARYGPCIEYAGKAKKIFVAIPKGKTYEDLTFEDCAILVNKKKENDKKGKAKGTTTAGGKKKAPYEGKKKKI